MTRLICVFKTKDFNQKYVKEFSPIKAGNFDVNKKGSLTKDYSTYWLISQKGSFNVVGGWEKQKDKVQEDQHIYLQSILASLTDAVNSLLANKRDYVTRIPGFVQTRYPTHQYLHLDSPNYKDDDPYKNLIVHIPMETEGMVLQMAKLQEGSENGKPELSHQFIHIPFGSGVILPFNQLHAGHYEKKGNL